MAGFTFAVTFPFLVGIGMVACSLPPVNRLVMRFYPLYVKVEPILMGLGLAFLPLFIWAFWNLRGYQP